MTELTPCKTAASVRVVGVGNDVSALFDSGAEINAITAELAGALPRAPRRPTNMKIGGFASTTHANEIVDVPAAT